MEYKVRKYKKWHQVSIHLFSLKIQGWAGSSPIDWGRRATVCSGQQSSGGHVKSSHFTKKVHLIATQANQSALPIFKKML